MRNTMRIIAKVSAALCVLMCVLLLAACSSSKNKVETPYCTLTLPDSYKDKVETEVVTKEPYVLKFKAKDGTELYTLYFGQQQEALLGTLCLEKENVPIYAVFAQLDSSKKNYNKYCGYQEEINTILDSLEKDYDFVKGELIPFEDNGTFDIKTSLVTLKYPSKWKDKVKVDVSDDMVKFATTDGVQLFDLVFKECDGYLLGTYKKTPIYIVDYTVQTDEQAAMQEDVNVILQNLMEDKKFKVNSN